jgi:TRAP-type mannitol/chloroaromatic compound transport system permease large subunit
VAPAEPYHDAVTGQLMAPVKTTDIYLGALPFVGLQLIMVGVVIAFPSLLHFNPAPVLPMPTNLHQPFDAIPHLPLKNFKP